MSEIETIKYVCFVENCEETFKTLGEVKFHLRQIHTLQSLDHYICCVPYCFQTFSSFKNFSRHMKTCLSEIPDVNNHTSLTIDNECLTLAESSNMSSVSISETTLSSTTTAPTFTETITTASLPTTSLSEPQSEEKGDIFFTTKYVSRNNISRADIFEIQDDVQKCITNRIGEMIRTNVLNKLRSGSFSSSELISALEEILEICEDPFKDINTEYKFFQYMEKNDLFHKPSDVLLSETIGPMVDNYECTLGPISTHVNLQDLEFQFRKFFELPEILEETLKNMNDLEQDTLLKLQG